MPKMKWYDWAAYILLVVGGLNWGLVGLFNFNLVEAIFGTAVLTKIVYGLVGVSSIVAIARLIKLAK